MDRVRYRARGVTGSSILVANVLIQYTRNSDSQQMSAASADAEAVGAEPAASEATPAMPETPPLKVPPVNLRQCTQCKAVITLDGARKARHAVPCGHVVCGPCFDQLSLTGERTTRLCQSAGCARIFEVSKVWVTAWCVWRGCRIEAELADLVKDQGNVGDAAPEPQCVECEPDPSTGRTHAATHRCATCGADTVFCDSVAAAHRSTRALRSHVVTKLGSSSLPGEDNGKRGNPTVGPIPAETWRLCAEHKSEIIMAETTTKRPLCAECMAASVGDVVVQPVGLALAALAPTNDSLVAQATKFADGLADLKSIAGTFGDAFIAETDAWAADETARVRAWEAQEVKAVQEVAEKTIAAIEHARILRMDSAKSLVAQRLAVKATIEEMSHEESGAEPSHPVDLMSKQLILRAERERLVATLVKSNGFAVLEDALAGWLAPLPSLAREFGEFKNADHPAGGSSVLAAVTPDNTERRAWRSAAKLQLAQMRMPHLLLDRCASIPPLVRAGSFVCLPLHRSFAIYVSLSMVPPAPLSPQCSYIVRSLVDSPECIVPLSDHEVFLGYDSVTKPEVFDLKSGSFRVVSSEYQFIWRACAVSGGRVAVQCGQQIVERDSYYGTIRTTKPPSNDSRPIALMDVKSGSVQILGKDRGRCVFAFTGKSLLVASRYSVEVFQESMDGKVRSRSCGLVPFGGVVADASHLLHFPPSRSSLVTLASACLTTSRHASRCFRTPWWRSARTAASLSLTGRRGRELRFWSSAGTSDLFTSFSMAKSSQ